MDANTGAAFLSGATTYLGVSSKLQSAAATRAQGTFAAAADARNAQIADLQAADATARGEISADIKGAQVRQNIGASRASLAAQGLDLTSGSPLGVQENEARLGALDVATIRNNAAREAWGYTMTSQNYTLQGKLAKSAADQAAAGETNSAWSTLLTGAAKTYGIYRDKKN